MNKKIVLGILFIVTQFESLYAEVKLTNFSEDESEKIYNAIHILEVVRKSDVFKTRVLEFAYDGKKGFLENNNLSNEEIYKMVSTINVDLELVLYYKNNHTVGYKEPGSQKIWINNKFFSRFTPREVAGNLFHEWTHILGFTHSTFYSKGREATVPYALGDLVVELGSNL